MRESMYCHVCDKDFTADINLKGDGNHVIICPTCGHAHCRVVKDGEITTDRWDKRNGAMGAVYYSTTSSAITNSTSSNNFNSMAWSNTITATSCY